MNVFGGWWFRFWIVPWVIRVGDDLSLGVGFVDMSSLDIPCVGISLLLLRNPD